MASRLNLEESATPGGGTEGDEQLGEDRDWVSLGMRRELADDLAGEAVIGGGSGRRRPPVRRRQRQPVGRPPIVGLTGQ